MWWGLRIRASIADFSCSSSRRSEWSEHCRRHHGTDGWGVFVAELGNDYYDDPYLIRDGMRLGRSFNLIHLPSTFEIDIFLLPSTPTAGPVLASPEDTILAQLRWYRMSSGSSEQQWKDISGSDRRPTRNPGSRVPHAPGRPTGLNDLLDRAMPERHKAHDFDLS